MSLYDIGTLPDDSWVNEEFTATVEGLEKKQSKAGKLFYTFTLVDPDTKQEIKSTSFSPGFYKYASKVCCFSGQGIKKSSYNGYPQLSISEKARVDILGDAVQGERHEGHSQPPQSTFKGKPSHPTTMAGQGAQSGSGGIAGITVGMAINNACNLLAHGVINRDSRIFSEQLHEVASDIIRVSQFMEKGNLADHPLKRNQGGGQTSQSPSPKQQTLAPQQQQRPPQPPPTPIEELEEDDIPF